MDTYAPWKCEPRTVAIPEELATVGVSYDLPGVALFQVVSFGFKLDTDANAANRQVVAELLDSTGATVFGILAPAVQTANTTVVYSFAAGVLPFGNLAAELMGGPFPGKTLPQNLTVAVRVAAAAVGDVLSDVRLLVHQYDLED